MEFSRQEYWNGLPFPSPGDLLDPRIEPGSPVLAGRFFYYLSHQGSPLTILKVLTNIFQVLGCQGKFYVFSISCCPVMEDAVMLKRAIFLPYTASLVAQMVKNLPAM